VSGELGLAFAVVFLAGISTGLTGFGFALVTVPPLLLIYDPTTVVAVRFLLSLSGGWIPLLDSWRSTRIRVLLGLMPWACSGMYLGVRLLEELPIAWIKLLASVVAIAFALLLMHRRGGVSPGWESPLATALAGLTSGTLGTSTGLSGPPVVVLLTSRGYGVQAFRATILAYLLVTDAIGLPALMAGGAVGEAQLRVAGLLMPAAFAGRFVGMAIVRRVTPETFRRLTLILLLATGAVGAINAATSLF
jgi:uncharacterized membrane protein YfcA